MTAISRKTIQDSWINIINYGIQQTENGSTTNPFSFTKMGRNFLGALNNGLYGLKNIFMEYMHEIFAWTLVIATAMILVFYAVGLAKATFFKSANRRKEFLRVLLALPLLFWCFTEFFLILFRILPDNQEEDQPAISKTSRFARGVKKNISNRSFDTRWSKLKEAKQDDIVYYEG